MRSVFAGIGRKVAPLASLAISGLLVLLITYIGWAVFPHPGTVNSESVYQEAGRGKGEAPRTIPVFIMRPDHSVIRHGTATLDANGRVAVTIFASTAGKVPEASEALLFEPTVAVLWAAASETSRGELNRRFDDVQQEATHGLERLITSDVFTNVYRPVLRAILTDAVAHAWEDAKTQSAFADLLASSDAAFRARMTQGMQDIILARVNDAVWDMLSTNWLNAFGVPLGYGLDYSPVSRAIATTLLDPRLQQTLVEFGSERLGTAEARRLAERIVIDAAQALMSDRRILDVVSAMFWDPRLRDLVRPFTDAAFELGAALPRNLGGLGATSTLNPLAAYIFRAIVIGPHTPLVLFVTPGESARIERLAPGVAKVLRRAGAERAT
jgi:hypothetical protein